MDALLIAFVAALTWSGWRRGLFKTLAGLAFIGISFLLGAYLSGPFGNLVNSFFPDVPADYAALLGYAFVFPAVLILLHVVARPFLKDRKPGRLTEAANKTLGAIFGFLEGVLILSVAVVVFDTYFAGGVSAGKTPGLSFIESFVTSFNSTYTVQLLRSTTVPLVLTILGPLLPKDISSLVPTGVPGIPGIPGVPGVPIPGVPTPRH